MYCAPANSCKFRWLGISDAVCTPHSVEFHEREKISETSVAFAQVCLILSREIIAMSIQ